MKDQEFYKILKEVPLDYYQEGVKKNPLQKYWHTTKVDFAIKLMTFSPRFKRGVSPLEKNDISESNSSAESDSAVFLGSAIKEIPFKKCLDVGCASGHMLSKIAKRFPNAKFFGVDAYKEAIVYAKKKYPSIKFINAEAEKLPFKANSFDLVLCYETIEHVRSPKKTMSEIKRVLTPGGTLILSMDSGNLAFKIIWFFWERTYGKVWERAHLTAFHHTGLEKLIKKSGFVIEEKHFTHFGLEVVYVLKKP